MKQRKEQQSSEDSVQSEAAASESEFDSEEEAMRGKP